MLFKAIVLLCAVSIVNCQLGATDSCQCDCGASDNTPLEKPNDDDVLGPICVFDCSDAVTSAYIRCISRPTFACVERVLMVKSSKCIPCICEIYPYLFNECLRQLLDQY